MSYRLVVFFTFLIVVTSLMFAVKIEHTENLNIDKVGLKFNIEKRKIRNISLKKQEILIYYANETDLNFESKYYSDSLISLIDNSKIDKLSDLRKHLLSDSEEFENALSKDLFIGKSGSISGNLLAATIPVLVFTNSLAKEGFFIEINEGKVTKKNFLVDSSLVFPLTSKKSLTAALNATMKLYDPKLYSYNIHINSHGDGENIIRPLVNFDSNKITATQFRSSFKRALLIKNSLSKYVAAKGADTSKGHDTYKGIGVSKGVKQLLHIVENEVGTLYETVTKDNLLAILTNLSKEHNVQFGSLILDSCYSSVAEVKIPDELIINSIYSFNGPVEYFSIDYSNIFQFDKNISLDDKINIWIKTLPKKS